MICFKIPSFNYSESDTARNITVTVKDIKVTSSLKLIYRANLTAVFNSVDRHRSGTAGGTLLVINGLRFSKNSCSMRIQLGKSEFLNSPGAIVGSQFALLNNTIVPIKTF